jgi:hypothetical protein
MVLEVAGANSLGGLLIRTSISKGSFGSLFVVVLSSIFVTSMSLT